MKTVKLSGIDEHLDLLAKLTDAGIPLGVNVFLSGGFVRDVANGRKFKDIDFAVVNSTGCPSVTETLTAVIEGLPGGYELAKVYDRDDSCSYTEKFPDEEDRFLEIRQFASTAEALPPIDLLFYTDSFRSIDAVMDSHDHSINQYAAWHGPFGVVAGYFGDKHGKCFQIRKGVLPDRIEYVKTICAELGWTYDGLHPRIAPLLDIEDFL